MLGQKGAENAHENAAVVVVEYEGRLAMATRSFRGAKPDELTVVPGQALVVLRVFSDGWCVVQNEDGETGLVPANHIGARCMPSWRARCLWRVCARAYARCVFPASRVTSVVAQTLRTRTPSYVCHHIYAKYTRRVYPLQAAMTQSGPSVSHRWMSRPATTR